MQEPKGSSMKRRLKRLGLAQAATVGLLVMTAPIAQAQFTSSENHTELVGEQTERLVTTAGAGVGGISCETVTFSGTMSEASQTAVVVSPTYAGCKDSLGRTVHVTKNTLNYEYTITGTVEGTPSGTLHSTGELIMTVTGSPHCTFTITGPQTFNGVIYHNLGLTQGIRVTLNSTNIHFDISGGIFACGTAAATSTTGILQGSLTIRGLRAGIGYVLISLDAP
jgi:hypothetical protein